MTKPSCGLTIIIDLRDIGNDKYRQRKNRRFGIECPIFIFCTIKCTRLSKSQHLFCGGTTSKHMVVYSENQLISSRVREVHIERTSANVVSERSEPVFGRLVK